VINEVSNKAAKANCFKTNKKLEIVGAHRKPEDVSQQKKVDDSNIFKVSPVAPGPAGLKEESPN
jgi:predicted CoA-binding protein